MPEDRILWGWSSVGTEIGRILGTEPSYRTLMRWAQGGMPIHRHPVTGMRWAYAEEIGAWLKLAQ